MNNNPYPTTSARRSDPGTSHQSAANVKYRSGSQKVLLLAAYARHDDLTSEEAAQLAAINPRSCWWKRVSELQQASLIEFTGETRLSSVGEAQRVYRITDAGKAILNIE